jgi:hypothetical protein
MREAQRNTLPSLGRKSPHQMAGDRFPPRNNTDRISVLENKINEQFKTVNETLLALATHIQNTGVKSPPVIEEPPTPRVWSPEKSSMLLWDKKENGVSWDNHYKGSKAFLVCGGPSLNDIDLSLLSNRGVVSMAMNNSWLKVNPTFWLGFDDPGRFHYDRWMDPSILKFVPWHQREKNLYKRVGDELVKTEQTPLDMPNCWFLSNTATFNEDTWFTEKDANWGGAVKGLEPGGGFRVTMFGALRTLYYLGFQEIYLIGCDWEMSLEGNAYAWEEDKDGEVKERNNNMYSWMEQVFKKLQPGFDRANFQIYNCNRNSKLSLFPFIEYEEAIERCTLPDVVDTKGWYNVPNEGSQ